MRDLIDKITVSSVLNRNIKQFGKANLFDNNPETCWNSDCGIPQWIEVALSSPVRLSSLQLQFQGGFAGLDTTLEAWNSTGASAVNFSIRLYPQDNNSLQEFPLPTLLDRYLYYRIIFNSTTDFYGRVVVYQLRFIPAEEE